MLCTLNHGPAPSLSRFSEECSHGGIISGHWLGVGSVMRHFLSRSWPELHRRIICPAGFLPYTIHGTSIRTIPYYTMPVYYLHGTGAHGTVSQAHKPSCLRSDRRRNVISSCSRNQPQSQTLITHNCN